MIEQYINKVIQGDCLEVMKQMPDKCVDLVLTDPPYGIDIGKMNFTNSTKGGVAVRTNYKGLADWDKCTPTQEIFNEIIRVSKNQIIFGGQYFTDKLPPSNGWVVWDKRTEDKYSNDFADCELAWTSFDKPSRVVRYLWSGMMQGNMKNKEIRHHPTQKPVQVMKDILIKYKDKEIERYQGSEIVLDPFSGSGSTLVAAKELGMNYIGIELSQKYCDIANERLAQDLLF